ncbi:MAG: hypothetical protein WDZ41_05660 [Candidatus Babeliales bacterium]
MNKPINTFSLLLLLVTSSAFANVPDRNFFKNSENFKNFTNDVIEELTKLDKETELSKSTLENKNNPLKLVRILGLSGIGTFIANIFRSSEFDTVRVENLKKQLETTEHALFEFLPTVANNDDLKVLYLAIIAGKVKKAEEIRESILSKSRNRTKLEEKLEQKINEINTPENVEDTSAC